LRLLIRSWKVAELYRQTGKRGPVDEKTIAMMVGWALTMVSYGASPVDLARLMGAHTGKILKGAKPADIPVQQSTRFELGINLKTGKSAWPHSGGASIASFGDAWKVGSGLIVISSLFA
jgi:hypothetical protein